MEKIPASEASNNQKAAPKAAKQKTVHEKPASAQSARKRCVLEDRPCVQCGECERCDLDPEKICDNCGKCIDSDADYNGIEIDDIILNF